MINGIAGQCRGKYGELFTSFFVTILIFSIQRTASQALEFFVLLLFLVSNFPRVPRV